MADTSPNPSAAAYSYLRFSNPDQARGDSIRRQSEAAAAWCARNGVTLDKSATFRDMGRSAFLGEHTKNPERHALARFLQLVTDGRVARGSYLIVENLDRLSRQHIRPALGLLLQLIEAGVRVVQLHPAEQVFDEDVEPMMLMMAIMELSRGHGESAIKSDRNRASWVKKRREARESGAPMTSRTPGWVENQGGKFRLIPDRAATVRRIFAMSSGGKGAAQIARALNAESTPPFGKAGGWSRSYVTALIADRRTLGEFQPRFADRSPDGDPIPDYYPRCVTDQAFYSAQAASGGRKIERARGQVGRRVELFSGLLKNAADGDDFYVTNRVAKDGTPYRVMANRAYVERGEACVSFPIESFERAALATLREVDPRELTRGDEPDETLALAGELAGVGEEIAAIVADLDRIYSPALAGVLVRKEERKRQLAERLAEARRRAASPLSETWGEAQSLLGILDSATDPKEVRTRLRAAIRQVVGSVWVLIVPRGKDRLCAAQMWFAEDGGSRTYVILHRAKRGNLQARTPGGWHAVSLASVAGEVTFDLRDRHHAARLAEVLRGVDLAALERPPEAR